MIKITPRATGAARLKRAQQAGREGRPALGRKIDIFRDTDWVGPLPIFTFLLVPTPGHSIGHTSVIVRDDKFAYFLSGDATYTEANLRADRVDGVTYNPAISLASLRAINDFAAREPTILLPSHDPDGLARLTKRSTL
jgi:glyoxylase-like metal-dependent hydrolase (beta-lactamase superfamily II)